jgi:hypothetical protein
MYLNTFIGGNVCATAKQAQERGGGHSSIPSLWSAVGGSTVGIPASKRCDFNVVLSFHIASKQNHQNHSRVPNPTALKLVLGGLAECTYRLETE